MKIGIVGTGNWGANLVRSFYSLVGSENIVVYDIDEDKLARLRIKYPGIKSEKNFEKILSDEKVTAIVIATPAEYHYQLSKQALLYDKSVLVEKPITLSVKEAADLIQIAEERKLTLMVDHLLEYHSAVEELKKIIDKGELGDIYYISSQRLNLGIIRSNENALWSLAPHDISVYLYLLDREPDFVSATGGAYIQSKESIEDTVFLHLRFPGGIDAHAHLSWLDPNKVRRLTVVGSDKMAVFDDMEPRNKLTIYDKGVEWSEERSVIVRYGDIYIPNIPLKEPLIESCKHFLECVEKRKKPRSDGYDGLKVIKILEKAQESLKKER